MDKRTKLAFILIALVLGMNLIIMDRLAPKRATVSGAADSASVSASGRTATPPRSEIQPALGVDSGISEVVPRVEAGNVGAAGQEAFTAASASDPEVEVRTPLYELRIATAGGVITSLRLPKFTLHDDGAVNLIAPHLTGTNRTALGLQIQTPAGAVDLTRARFEVVTQLATPFVLDVPAGAAPQRLTLRCAARDGGAILEHLVFDPDKYHIGIELELERGPGLPEVTSYTLSWTGGLASTEVNHKDDWASFKVSACVEGEVHKHGLAGAFGGGGGEKTTTYTGRVDWVSSQTKYFTVALLPQTQEGGTVHLRTDARVHWHGFELTHPLAWRTGEREAYTLYAGPLDVHLLAEHGRRLEALVDLGWSFVRPISKVILGAMNFVHGFIPNYGVVILILSLATQFLFWPLTERSIKSMRKMQNLQPMVQELKKRYKDPQEMNREMMALWRREGVNPMGGCMPMLVQIPVLFALYSALRSSIDLRGAPFMLWIDNLAAPDVLFNLPFPIPGLGRELCLLPLLMGAAMVWRSVISPAMPGATGAAAQQQLIMKWLMPVVMIFIFYKMPSGLVLYWLVNSLVGVWQQVVINRKFAPVAAVSNSAVPETAKQGSKDSAAAGRGDGRQRGRGAGQSADRVGGKAR